jgi:hypothetical protein
MIKVVWVCSLDLNILKKEFKGKKSDTLATWITYLIKELKHRNDIELHIITSNKNIKRDILFVEEGVHYYLLKENDLKFLPPPIKRRLLKYFQVLFSYKIILRKIRKTIEKVNPDIINTHGTEHVNSLCLKYFPNTHSIVWIQGIINRKMFFPQTFINKRKARLERLVFENNKYFITGGIKYIENIINTYNKNTRFFAFYLIINLRNIYVILFL